MGDNLCLLNVDENLTWAIPSHLPGISMLPSVFHTSMSWWAGELWEAYQSVPRQSGRKGAYPLLFVRPKPLWGSIPPPREGDWLQLHQHLILWIPLHVSFLFLYLKGSFSSLGSGDRIGSCILQMVLTLECGLNKNQNLLLVVVLLRLDFLGANQGLISRGPKWSR